MSKLCLIFFLLADTVSLGFANHLLVSPEALASCISRNASTDRCSEGIPVAGVFANCLLAGSTNDSDADSLALRFLAPRTPSTLQLVALLDNTTAAANIPPIQWSLIEQTELLAALQADEAAGASYHAYLLPGQCMGEAVNTGAVQELTGLDMISPAALSWPSFLPLYHDLSAVFDGNIYSIPVHGTMSLLYYRRDVFAAAGLSPPRTWADTLAAAAALNGTDLNGNGYVDDNWGICLWQHPNCTGSGTPISAVLASMVQSAGWHSAMYFENAESARSVVLTAAWEAALKVVRDLARYAPPPPSTFFPDADCAYQPLFSRGRCAMAISIAGQFKLDSWGGGSSAVRGNVGAAVLPGSETVLDWKADRMVPCNTTRCPYAVSYNDSANGGGGEQLVNHAPYAGGAGPVMFINNRVSELERLASFYIISKAVSPSDSWPLVVSPATFHGPTRYEHITAASLPYWQSYNYHPTDLDSFLDATRRSLYSSNVATDLRSVGSTPWTAFLMRTAHLIAAAGAGGAAANQTTLAQVVNQSRAIFQANFTPKVLQAMHLSYIVSITKPPSQSDTGSANPPYGEGRSLGRTVLLAVVVAIGMVVLVSAAAVWRWRRWLSPQKLGHRRITAPGVGRRTTLVVTDIQDSTRLWECLPACVMDLALQLHHGTIRRCTTAVGGYESATEGDSFILAFRHPAAALLFALTVQDELMTLAWPGELLQDSVCQPVWASVSTRHAKIKNKSAAGVRSALVVPRPPTRPPTCVLPQTRAMLQTHGQTPTSGSTTHRDTAVLHTAIQHSAPLPRLNLAALHHYIPSLPTPSPLNLSRTAAATTALDTHATLGSDTPQGSPVAAVAVAVGSTSARHSVQLPKELPANYEAQCIWPVAPSHSLTPTCNAVPAPDLSPPSASNPWDLSSPVFQRPSMGCLLTTPSFRPAASLPHRVSTIAMGPTEHNDTDEPVPTHASPTHRAVAATGTSVPSMFMGVHEPSLLSFPVSFGVGDISVRPRRCSTTALPCSLSLTALRTVNGSRGGAGGRDSGTLAILPEPAGLPPQASQTTAINYCDDGIIIGGGGDDGGDVDDNDAHVDALTLLRGHLPSIIGVARSAGQLAEQASPWQKTDEPCVSSIQTANSISYRRKGILPTPGTATTKNSNLRLSSWHLRTIRRAALLTPDDDSNTSHDDGPGLPNAGKHVSSTVAVVLSSGIRKHSSGHVGLLCCATSTDTPGGPSLTAGGANMGDSRARVAMGTVAVGCAQEGLHRREESVAVHTCSPAGGGLGGQGGWGRREAHVLTRPANCVRRPADEGVLGTDCSTEIMGGGDEDEQQDCVSQRLRLLLSSGGSGRSGWEVLQGEDSGGVESGTVEGGEDMSASRSCLNLQLAMHEQPPPPSNEPSSLWRHILPDMWRRHRLHKEQQQLQHQEASHSHHQQLRRPRQMLPRRPALAQKKGGKPPRRVLLLRGLRVRMGLHSGVLSEADVAYSRRMTRTLYSGVPMATAKAVASAAAGGMVVLSADTHALLTAAGAAGGGGGGPEFPAALSATQTKAGPMLLLPRLATASTSTPQRVVFWHGGVHVLDEHLPPLEVYMAATPAQVARWAVLPPPAEGGKGARVAAGVLHAPVGQLAVATVAVSGAGDIAAWNHDVWCQSASLLWREAAQLATDLDGFLATPRSAMMHPSPAATQPPSMPAQQQLQQLIMSRMARPSMSDSRAASSRGAVGPCSSIRGSLENTSPASLLLVAVFPTTASALRWAGGLLAYGMLAPWPPALFLHEHGGEVWKPRAPPPPPPSPSPPPGPSKPPTPHRQPLRPLSTPAMRSPPFQPTLFAGAKATNVRDICLGRPDKLSEAPPSDITNAFCSLGGLDAAQHPRTAYRGLSSVTIQLLSAASTHLATLPGAERPSSVRRLWKERRHFWRMAASGPIPAGSDCLHSTANELIVSARGGIASGGTTLSTAESHASESPPRLFKASSVPERALGLAPPITSVRSHTQYNAVGALRTRRGLAPLSCGTGGPVLQVAGSGAQIANVEVFPVALGDPTLRMEEEERTGGARQQEAARAGLGRARRELLEAITRRNAMRPLALPSVPQRKPLESYLFQRNIAPSYDDVVQSPPWYSSACASTSALGGGGAGGGHAPLRPVGSTGQHRTCHGYARISSPRPGSESVMARSATLSLGFLGPSVTAPAPAPAVGAPGAPCLREPPLRAVPQLPEPVCNNEGASSAMAGTAAGAGCSGGMLVVSRSSCTPQDSPLRSPFQTVDDVIQGSPGAPTGCGQVLSNSVHQGLGYLSCSPREGECLTGSAEASAGPRLQVSSMPRDGERAPTLPGLLLLRPQTAPLIPPSSRGQPSGIDDSGSGSGVPAAASVWNTPFHHYRHHGSNNGGGAVHTDRHADGQQQFAMMPYGSDGGQAAAGVGASASLSLSRSRLLLVVNSALQSVGTAAGHSAQFTTMVCPSVVPEALAPELLAASGPVPALPAWRAAEILRSGELSDLWLVRSLSPAGQAGLSVYLMSGGGSAAASTATPVIREGLLYVSTGDSDVQPAVNKSDAGGQQQSSPLSATALALLLPSSCSQQQQQHDGDLSQERQQQLHQHPGQLLHQEQKQQQQQPDRLIYSTDSVMPSSCTNTGKLSTCRSNALTGQGQRQTPTCDDWMLPPRRSLRGMSPRSEGAGLVAGVSEQAQGHTGVIPQAVPYSRDLPPAEATLAARRSLALPLELLEQLAARGLRLRAGVAEGMTAVQINAISGNAQYTGPAATLATSLALAAAPGTVLVSATAAAAVAATLADRSVLKGNASAFTPEGATLFSSQPRAGQNQGAKANSLQQASMNDCTKPAGFGSRAGLEGTRSLQTHLKALGLHPAIAARIRLQSEY